MFRFSLRAFRRHPEITLRRTYTKKSNPNFMHEASAVDEEEPKANDNKNNFNFNNNNDNNNKNNFKGGKVPFINTNFTFWDFMRLLWKDTTFILIAAALAGTALLLAKEKSKTNQIEQEYHKEAAFLTEKVYNTVGSQKKKWESRKEELLSGVPVANRDAIISFVENELLTSELSIEDEDDTENTTTTSSSEPNKRKGFF
eukprot:TRINITY_DN1481_c0_g1_i5.p1 TRINITY_DN1481_c0_g1~~TRINITY_DN1481_c0_g1_i5.p1  ORF type:complete len:200 (+),score=64.01 TRINITY_DN1481_c0_g1_i5:72-671(+)